VPTALQRICSPMVGTALVRLCPPNRITYGSL
jgi:hypothetical protein